MNSKNVNIINNYPVEARLLKAGLGFTLICLIIGLVSPLLTLEKFLLIENTFSILSGTLELFVEGQYFLFFLISVFSILIPLLKITVLFKILSIKKIKTSRLQQYLHWMHLYGKWSMLDVFVVSVLVVSVKLGALASVELRYGLYFFSVAVLLTMLITARVVKLSDSSKNYIQNNKLTR